MTRRYVKMKRSKQAGGTFLMVQCCAKADLGTDRELWYPSSLCTPGQDTHQEVNHLLVKAVKAWVGTANRAKEMGEPEYAYRIVRCLPLHTVVDIDTVKVAVEVAEKGKPNSPIRHLGSGANTPKKALPPAIEEVTFCNIQGKPGKWQKVVTKVGFPVAA